MSQWDGPQFQPPYPPPRPGSSWAVPVALVLVGILGIIGIGYGVLKVTAPKPPSAEGLPTGDQPPAGGGDPQGVPTDAAHSLPSAPALLGKCRAAGEAKDRAKAAKMTFRVAYRDLSGYAVWIGSPDSDRVCAYQWSGEGAEILGLGAGGGGTPPGTSPVEVTGVAAVSIGGRTALEAEGSVGADVTRVRVKWAGGFPPSEAAVSSGWFLVHTVQDREPAGKATGTGCEVEAYDATGTLTRHVPCSPGF